MHKERTTGQNDFKFELYTVEEGENCMRNKKRVSKYINR